MDPLHLFRPDRSALPIGKVEAVASVGHKDHVPAHIGARPYRGRNAHVGGNAEDDHVLRTEPLQAKIEVGPDEGRIDALGDERLAFAGVEAGTE